MLNCVARRRQFTTGEMPTCFPRSRSIPTPWRECPSSRKKVLSKSPNGIDASTSQCCDGERGRSDESTSGAEEDVWPAAVDRVQLYSSPVDWALEVASGLVQPMPPNNLSDYLAAERTFLAWIRTGLALAGFGFVIARFGLFLRAMQPGVPSQSYGLSVW